jgi:hypothetical protein
MVIMFISRRLSTVKIFNTVVKVKRATFYEPWLGMYTYKGTQHLQSLSRLCKTSIKDSFSLPPLEEKFGYAKSMKVVVSSNSNHEKHEQMKIHKARSPSFGLPILRSEGCILVHSQKEQVKEEIF